MPQLPHRQNLINPIRLGRIQVGIWRNPGVNLIPPQWTIGLLASYLVSNLGCSCTSPIFGWLTAGCLLSDHVKSPCWGWLYQLRPVKSNFFKQKTIFLLLKSTILGDIHHFVDPIRTGFHLVSDSQRSWTSMRWRYRRCKKSVFFFVFFSYLFWRLLWPKMVNFLSFFPLFFLSFFAMTQMVIFLVAKCGFRYGKMP